MMKPTLLVTGATGYLGSNLIHQLIEDYDIVILKRRKSNTVRIDSILSRIAAVDIEDTQLSTLFSDRNITGVIHCATNYGRDENDLDDTIEANLILPLGLLKNALENKVHFFVNTDTILDKRINYYSLSKAQFKDWLHFFSNKIKAVNIELEHFYGMADDPSKFVSKIIKDLALNEEKELQLTLGEQKRSFIFIDDVVKAFKVILQNMDQLEGDFVSFQVGSKHQISIKDFVMLTKELCRNTKTTLNFGALPYRKNEAMEVCVDITKLERLGWSEQTSLKDGLTRAIDYQIKKSYSNKIQ